MQTGLRAGPKCTEPHRTAMMTSTVRLPPQAPFENSVYYNLRYTGISSVNRLGWRRKNLEYLCERHTFVCLSELRNSEAVVESALFSHLPTHRKYYHCGVGLAGQARPCWYNGNGAQASALEIATGSEQTGTTRSSSQVVHTCFGGRSQVSSERSSACIWTPNPTPTEWASSR